VALATGICPSRTGTRTEVGRGRHHGFSRFKLSQASLTTELGRSTDLGKEDT
jgi:hypothetical protein